jgi:uncharacterized protein (DUF433 family)
MFFLPRITINPQQMGGVPCIRGLRIPVATVVDMVAAGMTETEILREFPDLEPEDIREARLYWSIRERYGRSHLPISVIAFTITMLLIALHYVVLHNIQMMEANRIEGDAAAYYRAGNHLWGTMSIASTPFLFTALTALFQVGRGHSSIKKGIYFAFAIPLLGYGLLLTPYFVALFELFFGITAIAIVFSLLASFSKEVRSLALMAILTNVVWFLIWRYYIVSLWDLSESIRFT